MNVLDALFWPLVGGVALFMAYHFATILIAMFRIDSDGGGSGRHSASGGLGGDNIGASIGDITGGTDSGGSDSGDTGGSGGDFTGGGGEYGGGGSSGSWS